MPPREVTHVAGDMTAGATMAPTAKAGEVLSVGPFRLAVAERLLKRDSVPIELGVRALDALVSLVSRPNEAIAKRDLMAQVWPDVTVGEASLLPHRHPA
jgi:DNA-binding winged helix-turn-helix (wHTH) protein